MSTSNSPGDFAVASNASKNRNRIAIWITAVVIVASVTLAISMLIKGGNSTKAQYKTADVTQGDITVTIAATGTLQPVNQVDVGSEISGTIEEVAVDYNQRVRRGQVLARLSTDRLQAQVIQGRASLAVAKAKLEDAKATLVETSTRFNRCQELAARQMCSQDELDTLRAASIRAEADEKSAEAQISLAQASLDASEADLAKAVIRSPIDGLVLKRQIERGQTVAASLQAPILFTLAENLTQMELHISVDEADIGKVKEGQNAKFTVDAYPDAEFPASISQVRYAPQTVDGVVTYETILAVNNSGLQLRPGMTATAEIIVETLKDVLLVPNAALRFSPPVIEETRSTGNGTLFGRLFPRPQRQSAKQVNTLEGKHRVWILQDGQPAPILIKTGSTDGQMTQVLEGSVEPGMKLLVDLASAVK